MSTKESSKKSNSPAIMTIMQKCIDYNIPYHLMKRLNYNDLLCMIVNYDIIKIKEYLKEKSRLEKNDKDYEIVDATPEMANSFFKH